MWKLSVIVREEDSMDQKYSFGEVVNFRKILGMGNNYPWNATTRGSFDHMTRKMILESDLSEIVLLMRNLVDSFSKDVVNNILGLLTKEYENGTINELKFPHHPVFGFWVSNWSKFNVFKNSAFDSENKAVQVYTVWPELEPWFSFVFPRPVKQCYVIVLT